MRDNLLAQCDLAHLSPKADEVARILIYAIDDNGYLPTPLDALFHPSQHPKNLNALIFQALNKIQTFEPIGVGARNLKECLLIQLQALPTQNETITLAHELVQFHLENLYKPAFLARKTHQPLERIQAALTMIQHLDPKPGRQVTEHRVETIRPDLKLHLHAGEPQVTLIPYPHYALKLHEPYLDAAMQHADLAEALQHAKQFLQQLEMRHQTLLNVGRAIISIQKDFFHQGTQELKPLTLQNLADVLGYHPSTLSRITSQKYIDTPRGIFELKYFLSGGIQSGEKHWASTTIKAMIKEWVSTENRATPLTDDALTQMLHAQGVQIARRTVTKYREALQIPSCVYRKCQE